MYKNETYKCSISVLRKQTVIGYNKDPLVLAKLYDDFIIKEGLGRKLNFPIYPENLIPNTKQIQLTRGKFAIVDESDFEWLNEFRWCACFDGTNWYAMMANNEGKRMGGITMHMLIFGKIDGLEIDHFNGDTLNNSRENLRHCTHAENGRNLRCRSGCSSKYKGVSWDKSMSMWSAIISKNYTTVHREYFSSEIEAALQYDLWATELFGEFARLNFPT